MSKFNVGDIVTPACDKLTYITYGSKYKVLGTLGDGVCLRVDDGGRCYYLDDELNLVAKGSFTKADLKPGMRVKRANGSIMSVVQKASGELVLIDKNGTWASPVVYNNDLTRQFSEYNIEEVYAEPFHESDLLNPLKYGKLLWKRGPDLAPFEAAVEQARKVCEEAEANLAKAEKALKEAQNGV